MSNELAIVTLVTWKTKLINQKKRRRRRRRKEIKQNKHKMGVYSKAYSQKK